MWCEQCQADVATEVSSDGESLLCTTCGQPAKTVIAPSLHPETQSAREFLERWAREQQELKTRADQTSATAPSTPPQASEKSLPSAESADPPSAGPTENDRDSAPLESPIRSKMKWRVDGQHTAPSGPTPSRRDRLRRPHLEKPPAEPVEAVPEPAVESTAEAASVAAANSTSSASPGERRQRKARIDASHEELPRPHFDPRTNAPRKTIFPGRSEAIWGQLLAYSGVGLLTVGTVLVLWGYFGDIEQYASTGWLVSTAGQMLLLLGIVTLVSGGMQQTTHEVSQRIEHLGGRIIRIEESTDKILKGPHFRRSRRSRQEAKVQGDEQNAA
jgi:hypothetical protein